MEALGASFLLWAAAFFANSLQVSADAHQSPCHGDFTSPQCVTAVRQLFADEDRYWFGKSYALACSFPPASFSSECVSNFDKVHRSLITRIRNSSDSNVSMIQQVLNVTFVAPAGSYQACQNTYQVPAVTKTVDPILTTNISLWSADHPPQVSWWGEANKKYTLIVWDAGAHFLHGVMFNIVGSNLDTAEIAWKFRGPKNPLDRDQPYVFLLYEQTRDLVAKDVQDSLIAFLTTSLQFAPFIIVNTLGLTGPVGASVLSVKTDLYAAEYMKVSRIVNYCPAALTPTFSTLPLSYDVSNARLMSSVDVTFTSPEISITSCCRDVTIAANSRSANPLGNGMIDPVYLRFTPFVSLVPSNFFETYYYLKSLYTLLLLDVTDELAQTQYPNTLLHWQVINVRQGDVTAGDTTLAYLPPLPETWNGRRTLMFLLLKQPSLSTLSVSDVNKFVSNSCPPRLNQRCRFNLTAFMTDLRMSVEGASWFMTSPDLYSRRKVVDDNLQLESVACVGVSGYSSPCENACTAETLVGSSSGQGRHVSSMTVLLSCFVLFFLRMIQA